MKEKMKAVHKAQNLVNKTRQKVYGHPYDDFGKVVQLTKPILDSDLDPRLKHSLYMLMVKIARLLNSPDHADSIIDAHGYINCYEMILECINKRTKNEK
jgi:hypothetical protein